MATGSATTGTAARGRTRLVRLVPTRLTATMHRAAYDLPLNLKSDGVKVTYDFVKDGVAYRVSYELSADDERQRQVWTMSCQLLLLYTVHGPVDDSLAQEFVPSMLLHAHNNLRELVHNLTHQMGMPPLVLDLFTLPEPEVASS